MTQSEEELKSEIKRLTRVIIDAAEECIEKGVPLIARSLRASIDEGESASPYPVESNDVIIHW